MNSQRDTQQPSQDVLRSLSRNEVDAALSYLEGWGIVYDAVVSVTRLRSFDCVAFMNDKMANLELTEYSYLQIYPVSNSVYDSIREFFFEKLTSKNEYIMVSNWKIGAETPNIAGSLGGFYMNNDGVEFFHKGVTFKNVDFMREKSPTLFIGVHEVFDEVSISFEEYLYRNINSYYVNVMDDELILYFSAAEL